MEGDGGDRGGEKATDGRGRAASNKNLAEKGRDEVRPNYRDDVVRGAGVCADKRLLALALSLRSDCRRIQGVWTFGGVRLRLLKMVLDGEQVSFLSFLRERHAQELACVD